MDGARAATGAAKRHVAWMVAVAVGMATVAASCSSTAGSTRSTSAGNGAGGGSLESLLSRMPTTVDFNGAQFAFVLGDVDAAVEASGLTRPAAATATDDDIAKWRLQLAALGGTEPQPSVGFTLPGTLQPATDRPVAAASTFGWSVLDIHGFIWDLWGTLTVLDIDASPQALTAAVGEPTDDVWAIGDEGTSFRWSLQQPALTSVRMSLQDGVLACAGSDAPVRAVLAGGATLADDPSFVEVTRSLDSTGAYYAVVLRPNQFSIDAFVRMNPRASQANIDERLQQLVPNTFDALGIGYSVRHGERVTTFVYHHSDAAAAAANAPVIEDLLRNGLSIKGNRPFSGMFTVESAVATGNLVIVTVTGNVQPVQLVNNVENMTVSK